MWEHVADIAQLRNGRLMIEVAGIAMLLLQTPRGLRAVEGWCPHGGNSLAKGRLLGSVIECPAHHWRFDLETGKVARDWWNPSVCRDLGARLAGFPVRVDADRILVDVSRIRLQSREG